MDSLMRDGTEAEQINAGPSDRSDCKFVPTPSPHRLPSFAPLTYRDLQRQWAASVSSCVCAGRILVIQDLTNHPAQTARILPIYASLALRNETVV
jgi:hypothetical protein